MLQGPLLIQYILGRIAVFVLAPFYFAAIRLMGYRVRNLRKIRQECSRHFRNHDGPWIICSNHLTMVDSPIIIYATVSLSSWQFSVILPSVSPSIAAVIVKR